jgi:hypothetical protein
VRQCHQHAMGFYAVDLVAFGERHPEHPINLLSARRRSFRPSSPWQKSPCCARSRRPDRDLRPHSLGRRTYSTARSVVPGAIAIWLACLGLATGHFCHGLLVVKRADLGRFRCYTKSCFSRS